MPKYELSLVYLFLITYDGLISLSLVSLIAPYQNSYMQYNEKNLQESTLILVDPFCKILLLKSYSYCVPTSVVIMVLKQTKASL